MIPFSPLSLTFDIQECPVLTSAHGIPIDDKLAVQTVGPRGLMLLQVCMSLGVMDIIHVYSLTLHNNVHLYSSSCVHVYRYRYITCIMFTYNE